MHLGRWLHAAEVLLRRDHIRRLELPLTTLVWIHLLDSVVRPLEASLRAPISVGGAKNALLLVVVVLKTSVYSALCLLLIVKVQHVVGLHFLRFTNLAVLAGDEVVAKNVLLLRDCVCVGLVRVSEVCVGIHDLPIVILPKRLMLLLSIDSRVSVKLLYFAIVVRLILVRILKLAITYLREDSIMLVFGPGFLVLVAVEANIAFITASLVLSYVAAKVFLLHFGACKHLTVPFFLVTCRVTKFQRSILRL